MKTTIAAIVGAALAAWPGVALACPACLGTDKQNATFLKVGSLFVLLPFAVVALVLYVLRQAPDASKPKAEAAPVPAPVAKVVPFPPRRA